MIAWASEDGILVQFGEQFVALASFVGIFEAIVWEVSVDEFR